MKKLLLVPSLFFVVSAWGMCDLYDDIMKGNIERVKELVEGGEVSLEEKCNLMESTPLMYASFFNQLEIVKYLIGKGAKLDIRDGQGMTCLDWAYCKEDDNFPTIKYLLDCESGIKLASKINILYRLCLGTTGKSGKNKNIVYLLEKGMDFNARDDRNKTSYDYLQVSKKHALRMKLSKYAPVILVCQGYLYDKDATLNVFPKDVINEVINKHVQISLTSAKAKVWQPVSEEAVKQHNALHNLQHDVSNPEKNLRRIVCYWSPGEQQKVSEKLLALGM
jgi:ankyrin repeat protein